MQLRMMRRKKMSKKLILLIDGENILHQSFHKFEKLKSTNGKPSGAIFGFFKSLHMYLIRFNPSKVVISFDNGHSKYRDELLPNYKGHRKNIAYDYESLQSQKRQIIGILRMLRITYIYDKHKISNYEGDDFLAYLYLTTHVTGENKYLLISSDKDFNQLLGKDLKIFNPRKESIVTEKNCKELFGYDAHETVDYLSLVGDTSDDIPGLKGYGPVKTRKFLDEYGSIENALTKDFKERGLIEKVYKRNQQLIDLRWFITNHPDSKVNDILKFYPNKKIATKRFRNKCIEYSLSSFLTEEFIKPFNELLK